MSFSRQQFNLNRIPGREERERRRDVLFQEMNDRALGGRNNRGRGILDTPGRPNGFEQIRSLPNPGSNFIRNTTSLIQQSRYTPQEQPPLRTFRHQPPLRPNVVPNNFRHDFPKPVPYQSRPHHPVQAPQRLPIHSNLNSQIRFQGERGPRLTSQRELSSTSRSDIEKISNLTNTFSKQNKDNEQLFDKAATAINQLESLAKPLNILMEVLKNEPMKKLLKELINQDEKSDKSEKTQCGENRQSMSNPPQNFDRYHEQQHNYESYAYQRDRYADNFQQSRGNYEYANNNYARNLLKDDCRNRNPNYNSFEEAEYDRQYNNNNSNKSNQRKRKAESNMDLEIRSNNYGRSESGEKEKKDTISAAARKKLKKQNDDSEVVLNAMTKAYHLQAVDARILKKLIRKVSNSYNDVEQLCEKEARLHFYKATMGADFYQANSAKKREDVNPLTYCKTCNLQYSEVYLLENHILSIPHQQIVTLAKEFCKLGMQWFESFTYEEEGKNLPVEQNGVTINVMENVKDFSNAEMGITDKFYEEFDVSKLTITQFIEKSCKKRMETIWPNSAKSYVCKVCNYIGFDTQESLEWHFKSQKHMDYQNSYKVAFCETCQHNFGMKEELRKHQETPFHRRAVKLLQEIRLHATKYWNFKRLNQVEEKITVKKHAKTFYKQSRQSFASTLHPGLFQAAAVEMPEKSGKEIRVEKDDAVYDQLFKIKPDDKLLADNFITSTGCKLCPKVFVPTEATRESHMSSKKHQKLLMKYLRDNKDEFLTPGGCLLCQTSFKGYDEEYSMKHRLSKQHIAKKQSYMFGKREESS